MKAISAPIGVSVLVPAGTVNTNIMRSERNWPAALGDAPQVERDPVSQMIHTGFTHAFAQGNDPRITVAPIPDAIRNGTFMISDDMKQCADWGVHPTTLAAGDNPTWPPA
jgi:hypothetical protein